MHPTLDDAKLHLPGIGGCDAGHRRRVILDSLPPRARTGGPPNRPFHGHPRDVAWRRRRNALVEHHRDIGAELGLNVGRPLGSQQVRRTVEMRSKLGAVFGDAPALGQAEHLIAAAVGQDRPVPPDEAMQTAGASDERVARSEIQVVGVAEDDLGAEPLAGPIAKIAQIAMCDAFDRSLRSDGHEGRRLHHSMGRTHLPAARRAVAREDTKLER